MIVVFLVGKEHRALVLSSTTRALCCFGQGFGFVATTLEEGFCSIPAYRALGKLTPISGDKHAAQVLES